ncbi:OstA-like protein [Pedobacter sp. SAFR-022]|uniref:OstA-like protein n=1 Tax=Pedobacter sp. SAFR-022 TaxID=3436861 RepID=UPI003F81264F
MQKLHYLLFFILLPFTVLAQKRTKITLVNSQHSTVDLKASISYLRKPVFQQDNAILRCDSAVFFEARNVFEAYNNVHINQADTVNIYSDRLTYDGNTKMAHLSSNVRLLDRTSVLTTNILDYNMNTKVGTYVQGGKIVSKDAKGGNEVTVTSKNGYYFANTRDAYFRYDVVVVSPEVKILSDTMRYNTLNNWTYFYGPTNIKGKDDNLYTENGAYNTKSEYAYFGKRNLYTSGSKSLKGDSLYYDGIAGYGKAVRNIVFSDTVDRTVLYGQLGYYYKADERALVTKNPYVGMGKDSVRVNDVLRPDTLWLGADTLETQMVLRQTLKLLPRPVVKKDNEIGSDAVPEGEDPKAARRKRNAAAQAGNGEGNEAGNAPPDSTGKQVTPRDSTLKTPVPKPADSVRNKPPVKPADSVSKTVPRKLGTADSTATDSVGKTVAQKLGTTDSTASAKVTGARAKITGAKTAAAADTTKNKTPLKAAPVLNPSDTVKVRTIKAYHNVRVYKSNLQAKSDSLFYNSADSTLRWFHNPIMWGEGSQQTGDTIYLQMRNSKLSSVQVLQSAFAVNVEKDSAHFNQVKGKVMTGFFKEGKIQTLYVDGNAESIYFTKDDNVYKEMNQTVSSRLKITFKDDEIADLLTIKEAESAITPLSQLKEDVFLTGFIWKPELRPLSKRDITNPKARKAASTAKKPAGPKGKAAAAPDKNDPDAEESGVKRTDTTVKANAAAAARGNAAGSEEKQRDSTKRLSPNQTKAAATADKSGLQTDTTAIKRSVKDTLPADKTAVSGSPAAKPAARPATGQKAPAAAQKGSASGQQKGAAVGQQNSAAGKQKTAADTLSKKPVK